MLRLVLRAGPGPDLGLLGPPVNVWQGDDGRPFARGFAGRAGAWLEWRGLGVFQFSRGSREVLGWPDAGHTPASFADVFSRVVQPVILQALGWQALHASAVCGLNGVVAFCGVSGAGKSTLAYAIQGRGFRQYADDALALRITDTEITVEPLPFRSKLRPDSARHLSAVTMSPPSAPDATVPLPLAGIFLLEQRQEASPLPVEVRDVAPARAFTSLVAHAHCFSESDDAGVRQLTEDYLTLSGAVPVLALTYSRGFGRVEELLDGAASAIARLGVLPMPDATHPTGASKQDPLGALRR